MPRRRARQQVTLAPPPWLDIHWGLNGSPFATWIRACSRSSGAPQRAAHQAHRTQVDSPWTNGKIERFWGVLQSELLDRELFPTPEAADEALSRFAVYYDYHRLNGAIGWQTPAERWDGTPITDHGFEHVPPLEHLQGWLAELN